MKTQLLLKVKEYILAHPNRFVMRAFVFTKDETGEFFTNDEHKYTKFDQCGTAACIAGWTCLIKMQGKTNDRINYHNKAAGYLNLDEEQANLLFYTDQWPDNFKIKYEQASSQEQRSQIAAQRIDHFIATKGKE